VGTTEDLSIKSQKMYLGNSLSRPGPNSFLLLCKGPGAVLELLLQAQQEP